MKLTPKIRNWIFYNIKKFHSEDLYLRTLNSNIILGEFKEKLLQSQTFEELNTLLNIPSFNKTFGFYRKDNLFFLYPSFKDQVISLIDCWPEIKNAYSNYYDSKIDQFESYEDEPFKQKQVPRKQKNKRISFGNRANISSDFRSEKSSTIHRHIMSSNRSIKVSFSHELSAFRNRAILEVNKAENRKKVYSYFVQTDLKSFFHSLDSEIVLKHIDGKMFKSREWIKKIQEDFPGGGLPIGWILSGFFADILMNKFSEYIRDNDIKIKRNLGLSHFTMINYVDDLIFFVSSKERKNKSNFLNDFCKVLQFEINNFFDTDVIKIHTPESTKTKFVELREGSIALMKSNWHDSNIASYGKPEATNKKWSMLDEFLLPADNDMFLNERVQFYNNLKNLKARVESGDISTKSEFIPLLDKILFKLSIDRKYLYSIVDTVFLFGSKKNELESLVERLWSSLILLSDLNALELINFLNSLHSYIKKKNQNIKIFHDYAFKVKKFIEENERFNNWDDRSLLNSFLTKFYLSHPHLENTLCVHAKSSDLYFYKSSCAALNYSDILTGGKILKVSGNPFIFNEVINLNSLNSPVLVFKNLGTLLKNINSFESQRKFLLMYVENFAYEFVPVFSKHDIENFLRLMDKYNIRAPIVEEIQNIFLNYDYLKNFFSKVQGDFASEFVYESRKTGGKNKDIFFEEFSLLLFKKHYKPYAFYREILGLIMLSCSSYKDALKVALFQYRNLDSFVFFSWSALPVSYNSCSHILLGVVKKILSNVTSSFNINSASKNLDLNDEVKSLKILGNYKIKKIDLKEFEDYMSFTALPFENDSQIKLMIANIEINIDTDFDAENDLKLTQKSSERINEEIKRALNQAIKHKCDVICFPELTLPEKYLQNYYNLAGENNLIIIGGTEYETISTEEIANATIICFPTSRTANALGKNYHTYKQFKNFIAIAEFSALKDIKSKKSFYEGSELIVFESNKVHNFSILTCSDFLSLENKFLLQGLVQTIFVPAMNFDNTTYHHVSQSAIREMYCICVVCNNSYMGASHICAPFRDEWRRTLFRIEGKSLPKTHTVVINPSLIKELQEIGEDKKRKFDKDKTILSSTETEELQFFKQVPPDWFKVRKKIS